MILNTKDYLDLMEKRAKGLLPEMGSAQRIAQLIQSFVNHNEYDISHQKIIDIGSATGHYLRSIKNQGLDFHEYMGLDIDQNMIEIGTKVWGNKCGNTTISFFTHNFDDDIDVPESDFSMCMNAFMYFKSPKRAIRKLMSSTNKAIFIRSYFDDSSYRILRPQTIDNHDKSNISTLDAFDINGDIPVFDMWNIYSTKFIEACVNELNPNAKVYWEQDKNLIDSMQEEDKLKLDKRGATTVLNNMEISFPFILPWRYLIICLDDKSSWVT